MEVPVRDDFTVGVKTDRVSAGGHLYVAPNVLRCMLGPVARRTSDFTEVAHSGFRVTVYRARLVPPWFNIAVLVDDGTRRIRASLPLLHFGRLVSSLEAAGFDVDVKSTWLDRGYPSV
jgi:hypothetical protein